MQNRENEINVSAEDWSRQVNQLADQVRMLALNLAISLARSKEKLEDLAQLEPEFTKLVNGSVEVVKEVTSILKAFRHEEKMVYTPQKSSNKLDRIETSLNEILELSSTVLKAIAEIKKHRGQVDRYNKA